ncbi:hypothetical protein [Flavobacterium tegetincola]|uniref:hypothetical protein n=1 Tax=Flavobacterium tegetincola TaxID=150172 RepID=UPI0003F70CBD|nr:hypothetical protein [Flavobacterium tegetincola]
MKTHLLTLALFGFLAQNPIVAQNRTTVNATNNEISDNLDLRAVASIFGDARDLQDFERQLNDPKNKISNLDLNFDRQVDYLRVIEAVEKNTHLIILQAVLERDVFQDVATIEVERDQNNQVQIQVVGDVFMYGQNYIYEPVYVNRPIIYNMFWVNNYNPYYSPYYFNYYPNYYYAWTPYPVYRYRRNVHVHINQYNNYNYCDNRRSTRAVAMYETRRSNGYERNHPNQSFATRNTATNRYTLNQAANSGRRTDYAATRNYSTSTSGTVRNATSARNVRSTNTTRNTNTAVRSTTPAKSVRSEALSSSRNRNTVTPSSAVRSATTQSTPTRNYSQQAVRSTSSNSNATRSTRSSAPSQSATRSESTRSSGNTSGSRTYSRS